MEYKKSLWKDEFERLDFEFEGRQAVIVFPKEENRTPRWLLKTEYFEAFQELELELVRKGFHLVYLKNINRWGINEDLDAKKRLRDFLMDEFGLAPRCVPVGMSCGGLHAIKQAACHPDMVSALFLDAPVVNLLSSPFGFGRRVDVDEGVCQEALDALGMTMQEMIVYRDHPLDRLGELVANRVPVVLMWGDADTVLPYEENGAYIQVAYEQAGIPSMFICRPGCGHHPHGPFEQDMERVVDFICKWG